MQKVAWPITIVQSENGTPAEGVKNEFSAMPVMIPGSASGRTSRNEIASRPKKRKRWTANAASRAEHERDRGREQRRLQRQQQRAARLLVVPGGAEPLGREAR